MITVKFHCSGCNAVADGKEPLRNTFVSICGRAYGLGSYHEDRASEVAPDGWIAFDPYTQVTYCPDCWADIESQMNKRS